MTICESYYENNQRHETFQDVMNAIEEKKQNIIASILYQRENFDLKNQSIFQNLGVHSNSVVKLKLVSKYRGRNRG